MFIVIDKEHSIRQTIECQRFLMRRDRHGQRCLVGSTGHLVLSIFSRLMGPLKMLVEGGYHHRT